MLRGARLGQLPAVQAVRVPRAVTSLGCRGGDYDGAALLYYCSFATRLPSLSVRSFCLQACKSETTVAFHLGAVGVPRPMSKRS